MAGAPVGAETPSSAGAPAGSADAPPNQPFSDADATREVAAWVEKLVSPDAAARDGAVRAIDRASPAMFPAIVERLVRLASTADRAGMEAVVTEIVRPRRAPRDEIAGRLPDGGFGQADDWFVLLLASAKPSQGPWRDVVTILGLARLLAKIPTTAAAREIAGLFPVFGELLRPDVERQLAILGARALPALIEMRRAEAREQRVFALKMLEALGKAIPGEAVQTGDDRLLAEVLLAYGRAREVDAVRVILSFASNDRRQVREAAREAMLALGELGFPALRESYENMTAQKPPEAWGWETTARELFAAFDRARLSDAYALMEEGLAAYRQNDATAAARAFDQALLRDPVFARRAEMAPAYLALARISKRENDGQTMGALRKVMRVDPSGPLAREAESELLVIEARERAARGVVDEPSLRRALELYPDNTEAKDELRRIEAESEARARRFSWYVYGALAALFALGGLVAAIAHGRRSAE
jgi:hypothetical protein